jgi:hypothetical protein
MQFQVTEIEFDFDDATDDFPEHQFSNITDETIGMILMRKISSRRSHVQQCIIH